MKFYAKVSMSDTKTAQEIVRVWGEHFNPESSIFIKGNEATVCFFFDDSPKEMTDILSKCRVDEFIYGSFNTAEDKTIVSQTKKEESNPTIKKSGGSKKNVKLPLLDQIAKKANSFDDFIIKVGKWLDMQTLQDTFENIVQVSCTMKDISWNEIEKELGERKIPFNSYIKMKISKKITAKLKLNGYFMRILTFIQALINYRDYQFAEEKDDEEETQTTTASTVKMNCMPYVESFYKALQDAKKLDSVEDKVSYIINVMAILPDYTTNYVEKVVSIVNAAMKEDNIDWDRIFDSISIPVDERDGDRMMLSKFINDYLKKYGYSEPIKTTDFLRDLKKALLYEESKNEE